LKSEESELRKANFEDVDIVDLEEVDEVKLVEVEFVMNI
jgi:hypothetical protein